ncbi:MAG: hypothetical protein HY319_22550 [Armatimonadetes bacterium]|nr:hypothetical protein [Armatimonadota bacterium]
MAFLSLASNLMNGDTNGKFDVFVHELATGTTSRVSVRTGGVQSAGGDLWEIAPPAQYLLACSISGDGRYVAFDSTASDLVDADTNGRQDIFVHDRWTNQTLRVNLGPGGVEGDRDSRVPSISGDGRFVSFMSQARNLTVPNQPGFLWDAFRARNVLAP